MPQLRHLLASMVLATLVVTVLASVVTAHPGHRMRLRAFDSIWVDLRDVGSFTAAPGDRDLVIGLGGDDVLAAGDLHDHVLGGPGNDTIDGGLGPDRLVGGHGDDAIVGEAVPSLVASGPRTGTAEVRPAHDWLFGGQGADSLAGGPVGSPPGRPAGRCPRWGRRT